MLNAGPIEWTVFAALVTGLLVVDFVIARRKEQDDSLRRAWAWSAIWIGVALAFGAWISIRLGSTPV